MKCRAFRWCCIALPLLGCAGEATHVSEAALVDQTVRSHVAIGSVSFDSITVAELSVSETDAGAHWRFEYVGGSQVGGAQDDRMVALQVAQADAAPWGTFDLTGPGPNTTEAALRYVEYPASTAPVPPTARPSAGNEVGVSPNTVSAQRGDDYREYMAQSGRIEIVEQADGQVVVRLASIRVTSVDDATDTLTFDGIITTQLKRTCYAFGVPSVSMESASTTTSPQISLAGQQTSRRLLQLDRAVATDFCMQHMRTD